MNFHSAAPSATGAQGCAHRRDRVNRGGQRDQAAPRGQDSATPYTTPCIVTATRSTTEQALVNSLLHVLDERLGSDLPEGRLRRSRSRRPGVAAPRRRRQSPARSSILFDASRKSAPPLEVVLGRELLSDNLGRDHRSEAGKSRAACARPCWSAPQHIRRRAAVESA